MSNKIPVHLEGTKVLCAEGHVIAILNRDLHQGDVGYSSALNFIPGQLSAKKGDTLPLLCRCGAFWFNDQHKRFPFTNYERKRRVLVDSTGRTDLHVSAVEDFGLRSYTSNT